MKITTTRAQALKRTQEYNQKGIKVSLSYLPVRSRSKEDSEEDVAEYVSLFGEIEEQKLDADVTIKLMQFGVSSDKKHAAECVDGLTKVAGEKGIRVWFDQGLEPYVSDVVSWAKKNSNQEAGICIQASRTRSDEDVKSATGYPIRLVKGFYNDYDIRPWDKVTANYSRLMDVVAEKSSYPCFATHDFELIEKAKLLLTKKNGEIQFFAGVRDDIAEQLVKDGYNVRVYVAYGRVLRFLWHGIPEFDMPRAVQRILGFKKIR